MLRKSTGIVSSAVAIIGLLISLIITAASTAADYGALKSNVTEIKVQQEKVFVELQQMRQDITDIKICIIPLKNITKNEENYDKSDL